MGVQRCPRTIFTFPYMSKHVGGRVRGRPWSSVDRPLERPTTAIQWVAVNTPVDKRTYF